MVMIKSMPTNERTSLVLLASPLGGGKKVWSQGSFPSHWMHFPFSQSSSWSQNPHPPPFRCCEANVTWDDWEAVGRSTQCERKGTSEDGCDVALTAHARVPPPPPQQQHLPPFFSRTYSALPLKPGGGRGRGKGGTKLRRNVPINSCDRYMPKKAKVWKLNGRTWLCVCVYVCVCVRMCVRACEWVCGQNACTGSWYIRLEPLSRESIEKARAAENWDETPLNKFTDILNIWSTRRKLLLTCDLL